MLVTHLSLVNWRNFQDVNVPFRDTTYLLGANATGKSNLLDVFRFLRDVSKAEGGGLQKAVNDRGGIPKLRCLHARRTTEVAIQVDLAITADDRVPEWRYRLAFKPEGKGAQRTLISSEKVWHRDRLLRDRPDPDDQSDPVGHLQKPLAEAAIG